MAAACFCAGCPPKQGTGDDGGADAAADVTFADDAADSATSTDAAEAGGGDGAPADAGADSAPGTVSVNVAPSGATLLTCSQTQFDASVVPSSAAQGVSWSATVGSIAPTGVFTAPVMPGTVTITATSLADAGVAGQSNDTLVDFALQGQVVAVLPMDTAVPFPLAYTHAMSSSGSVVYAAFPAQAPGGEVSPFVFRSGDAGKTWSPTTGRPQSPVALAAGDTPLYLAVAADAVDPATVYLAFSDASGSYLFFAVSTDSGATFQTVSLNAPSSWDWWPDVISPAAGTVVIMESSNYPGGGFAFWSDTTKGAGLVDADAGAAAATTYNPDPTNADENIGDNGNYQQPKLFTDGNGALCMAYLFTASDVATPVLWEPLIQCSPDLGVSWAPAIHFTTPSASSPGFPNGAIKSAGGGQARVTLSWADQPIGDGGLPVMTVHVATVTTAPTSFDAGAPLPPTVTTFDGTVGIPSGGSRTLTGLSDVRYDADGVLWLAYGAQYTALQSSVIVDKSCNDGVAWAGGAYVGVAGDQASWPGLVPLSAPPSAGMGISAQWGGAPQNDSGAPLMAEIFYRLSP